jgi:steroid delta-isomerase-like uncharacterized protein
MSVANKALVARYIEEVLNKGNVALMQELIAPDFIGHDASGIEVHGTESMKHHNARYRDAFPDQHFTVETVIAEKNIVVWRWTMHGTHKGEVMDIAPTGKQVSITGTTTCHITDGKIREVWNDWDALGLLQQLGVLRELRQEKR